MAINLTDFDKIWASSSPLTPYSFSDANYEEGWNFVGATPPARQMWDGYMKWSDEKQQWIVNNFLPLSGGTMTGNITLADSYANIKTDASSKYLRFMNLDYNGGASLYLYGATYNSADAGSFVLNAYDGNARKVLRGKSDGLTWDGDVVQTSKVYSASLEPESEFEMYSSGASINLKRIGNVVMIEGVVTPLSTLSSGDAHTICNIPSGYRPILTVRNVMQGSSATRWYFEISTSGVATANRYGTTSSTTISAGQWMPFSATFLTSDAYPS